MSLHAKFWLYIPILYSYISIFLYFGSIYPIFYIPILYSLYYIGKFICLGGGESEGGKSRTYSKRSCVIMVFSRFT